MEIIGQNGNDGEHYNEHIPEQEYNTNNQKLDSYNRTRQWEKIKPSIGDDKTKTY
jgi:hypothetical protein